MTDPTSAAGAPIDPSHAADSVWTRRTALACAALAGAVVLADELFYPHEPGVSLGIFCVALIAAVAALNWRGVWRRDSMLLGLAALAACLPLVESEALFWWPFAMMLVGLFALAAAGQLAAFEDWFGSSLRFAILGPVRLLADAVALLVEGVDRNLGGRLLRAGLVWLVPIACAIVFGALFVAANPVLELGLNALRPLLDWQLDLRRVVLWGFIAVVSWPILAPRLVCWTSQPPTQGPMLERAESIVFGAAAIRNSLILFNALFAVQTATDLLYLWGGVRLPDGLTYADYAHHAAYPLIVTAVLAGAFVLAAMRRNGPGRGSALIRGLVYLWVTQNVWLVISSILRLKLYVLAYGLSEWRLDAGVWMLLVAIGLVLVIAKVAYDRSNKWLVTANAVALTAVLWGVSLADYPGLISRFNVEHARETGGDGVPLDAAYLANLGRDAIPAMDTFLLTASHASPDLLKQVSVARDRLATEVLLDRDHSGRTLLRPVEWQSWTWRDQRLRDYLQAHPFAPPPIVADK